MIFALLILAWFFFLVLTFRYPGSPRVDRLFCFLVWLGLSGSLALKFAVDVLGYNPNPAKLRIANLLTENKLIDLTDIASGVYTLDHIQRIDTDGEDAISEEPDEEWVAFYRYDVTLSGVGTPLGPFGGAIYDPDYCRPPAIQSYELVPASYDYLGQDAVDMVVQNIMPDQSTQTGGSRQPVDRPEVIVNGYTRGVQTDLNIFRKTGPQFACPDRKEWARTHPGEPLPSFLAYENLGTFRGDYQVQRSGTTVTVVNRAGFERSQFTVRKTYEPQNGSYYVAGTEALLPPVRVTLAFGQGKPEDVPNVYYPEKVVLAFYQDLGNDRNKLKQAESYLSEAARQAYNINTNTFGLSAAPDSVARARSKLASVLIWEIAYEPDIAAEELHQPVRVTATVVGVNDKGQIDKEHPCDVTWTIIGVPNLKAPPYGVEWYLDSYRSNCPP